MDGDVTQRYAEMYLRPNLQVKEKKPMKAGRNFSGHKIHCDIGPFCDNNIVYEAPTTDRGPPPEILNR